MLTSENLNWNNRKPILKEIIQHAKSISDIIDNVNVDISEDKISINYFNNDHFINLWFCKFTIRWDISVISEFYTANLKWLSDYDKKNTQNPWMDEVDILDKPIKGIWKEIFKNLLDILSINWVKSIYLIYNKDSNSLDFYKKMKKYFPTYIDSINEWMPGSLIFNLN